MQLPRAVLLGLAGLVAGQSGTPDLANALQSQGNLTSLISLINGTSGLASALSQMTNVTILAPSNNAISKLLNSSMSAAMNQTGMIQSLLSYHILNGTYYASNFTANNMMAMFIPTHLTNPELSLVSGSQRVEIMSNNGNVTAYSGLKQASNFMTTNVNFTGGTIHIIDSVLTIPDNATYTLQQSNLTAAAGAVQVAGLNQTLDTTQNLTIFAPSNDAFNAVGSIFANISMQQLASSLEYHVVRGLDYSSSLMNGTLQTLSGGSINITSINGTVFVNDAKVTIPDILLKNGVLHVIDQVLNPNATGSNPQVSASTTTAAYTGASTGTAGVPFTSGITAPTSVAAAATSTSTKSNPAMAVKTGAVGAAALFGGAAVMINF